MPTGGISTACVAGETGVATLGVVVVAAVVLLMRAKVWREGSGARRWSSSHLSHPFGG